MYPISDLTAFCRKTTGDVPPKLVVCAYLTVCAICSEGDARPRVGRVHYRRRV